MANNTYHVTYRATWVSGRTHRADYWEGGRSRARSRQVSSPLRSGRATRGRHLPGSRPLQGGGRGSFSPASFAPETEQTRALCGGAGLSNIKGGNSARQSATTHVSRSRDWQQRRIFQRHTTRLAWCGLRKGRLQGAGLLG